MVDVLMPIPTQQMEGYRVLLAPGKKRTGRKKEFDPNEVAVRAAALFARIGYHRTGLSALEEAMGIGRQSLYDTFGHKEQLFRHCAKEVWEELVRVMWSGVMSQPHSFWKSSVRAVMKAWSPAGGE